MGSGREFMQREFIEGKSCPGGGDRGEVEGGWEKNQGVKKFPVPWCGGVSEPSDECTDSDVNPEGSVDMPYAVGDHFEDRIIGPLSMSVECGPSGRGHDDGAEETGEHSAGPTVLAVRRSFLRGFL
jgi:hypothetical protein